MGSSEGEGGRLRMTISPVQPHSCEARPLSGARRRLAHLTGALVWRQVSGTCSRVRLLQYSLPLVHPLRSHCRSPRAQSLASTRGR